MTALLPPAREDRAWAVAKAIADEQLFASGLFDDDALPELGDVDLAAFWSADVCIECHGRGGVHFADCLAIS